MRKKRIGIEKPSNEILREKTFSRFVKFISTFNDINTYLNEAAQITFQFSYFHYISYNIPTLTDEE